MAALYGQGCALRDPTYAARVIRVATAEDVDLLVALNEHVHVIHVEAEPQRYRRTQAQELRPWFAASVEDSSCVYWLAFVEGSGAPAGYLRAVVRELPPNPFGFGRRELEVDQLAVTPEARGQGWGRALMDAAEAYARERRCGSVVLSVMAFNAGARAFYEALGYVPQLTRMAKAL